MDIASNFVCLDELIQVIYSVINRFIFISSVSDSWVVHIGLVGSEGRWFRGTWGESDIRDALKVTPNGGSDKIFEGFATKLSNFIVEGKLSVEGIQDADPKLILGPSGQPLCMSLVELSSAEAASYTSNFLLDFALQVQSRKCTIHPSTFISPMSNTIRDPSPETAKEPTKPVEIIERKRKAQVEKESTPVQQQKEPSSKLDSKAKAPVKPRKGASLANPTKKARKVVAVEFASDEE